MVPVTDPSPGPRETPLTPAQVAGLFALMLVLAAVIYHPVASFDFLGYDDSEYVEDNAAIARGLSLDMLARAFTTVYHGNWQPVAIIAHAADVSLFGFNPGLHHVSSVAWHLLNSMLLFFLTWRLVQSAPAAAAVSVLFLVHPQHVEAVAWISSRQHLVGAAFFLLSLLAYTEYVRTRHGLAYAAVALALTAAVLAKSVMVTIPCVLLLLDWWPLGRLREKADIRRAILDKLPLFGIAVVYGIALVTRELEQNMLHSTETVPLGVRIDNMLFAYAAYLKTAFFPEGLSIHYPDTLSRLPGATLLLIAAVLALITAAALVTVRRFPAFFVSWFWFVGTLFLVSGIISFRFHSMADRYAYVPHMGLAVGLAAAGIGIARRPRLRFLPALLAAGFTVYFTAASAERVPRFRTDMLIFIESAERYPNNPFALNLVGYEFAAKTYSEEAVSMLLRSLDLTEWKALRTDAHQVAAVLFDNLDAPALACAHYAEELRLRPGTELTEVRKKQAQKAMRAREERIRALEETLRANDDAKLDRVLELARYYALHGRADDAVELYERAAEHGAPALDVAKGIVDAYTFAGRPEDALTAARAAHARAPEDPEAEYLLVRALCRDARFAEARSRLSPARTRHPGHIGIKRLHALLAE